MDGTANAGQVQPADDNNQQLRALKHDVKNQLSNILLAIEQLRYEIPEPSADCLFYLDSISMSSATIDKLLNEAG
ncbi:hypothetical protein [Mucilaginibacter xinganensis]|uniref:Signal transduction histidine kinase dimerisation/phosphoacceptor domain-containing protein n=1 Tax=Mucilaginibacter xinganensis TaxID=1234841 RepID=A0A223NSK3_9SPHI|nr:hypothetical protein [Mucilaginibacter xinganensis]ASU32491.1 hypothetical protein MuYL_0588 [Mucilaginibacter xinganensis]